MILVNTDYVSGKELETIALVKGSTIQSRHLGKDISQALKSLIGGELKSYNEMMESARELATKRMIDEAEKVNANASSAIANNAAEVIAYGTAVKFK